MKTEGRYAVFNFDNEDKLVAFALTLIIGSLLAFAVIMGLFAYSKQRTCIEAMKINPQAVSQSVCKYDAHDRD